MFSEEYKTLECVQEMKSLLSERSAFPIGDVVNND